MKKTERERKRLMLKVAGINKNVVRNKIDENK